LGIALVTLVLQIAATGLSGANSLDSLLPRVVAGIFLAGLGVVSAALGLRAFWNAYESSKCWSVSHFVMSCIAAVAYGIIFLLSINTIVYARDLVQEFYMMVVTADAESAEEEELFKNSSTTAAYTTSGGTGLTSSVATTTTDSIEEDLAILRALKGEMAISVLLLGVTLAFVSLSVIALVLICLNWWRARNKTMTILYVPEGQSPENAQTRSVVVPSKTQVVVVPTVKPAGSTTPAYANGFHDMM